MSKDLDKTKGHEMCGRHEQCGHQEADWSETSGTFYQGHINAKFDELVAVFGFPHGPADDDKSQVEWTVKFDDGVVATIYDWKQAANHWDVIDWHVGGFTRDAWLHVNDTMRQAGFPNEYRRFHQIGS